MSSNCSGISGAPQASSHVSLSSTPQRGGESPTVATPDGQSAVVTSIATSAISGVTTSSTPALRATEILPLASSSTSLSSPPLSSGSSSSRSPLTIATGPTAITTPPLTGIVSLDAEIFGCLPITDIGSAMSVNRATHALKEFILDAHLRNFKSMSPREIMPYQ